MNALLRDRLVSWEKRLRLQAAVRAAVWGSFGGAALAAAYVGGAKLWAWPQPLWVALGAFAAVPAIAFAARIARRIPLADVARAADRACGGEDRFSTALELDGSEWAALIERDAAAKPLPDEKKIFATHVPRLSKWSFAAAAAVAALLLFVPARTLPVIAAPNELKGLEAPPELTAAAEELREAGAEEGDGKLAELGKELERISEEWKEGKIDRKEALARIGELGERIREEKEKAAARREALATMGENGEGHEMAHGMASGKATDAVAERAARLGQNPSEDAKLADMLERAAKVAGKDKELAEALKKAADAARRGDKKAFEEAMKAAKERWKGLSKAGAEQARKDAAAAKAKGPKTGKLDPELLKKMEELLKAKGFDDEEVKKALDRLAKLSEKLGKDGKVGALDDEELKKLIEQLEGMDPGELKKFAEMLKKMSEKDLEELAKKLQKDCGGGS